MQKTEIERVSYSVVEAAQSIGISSRTLWTLIREGKIATCRVKKRVLISTDVLRAFIQEQTKINGNP